MKTNTYFEELDRIAKPSSTRSAREPARPTEPGVTAIPMR